MQKDDDYFEISPNEILDRVNRSPNIVRDPKIPNLPLNTLPWDDFEEIALRLFSEELQNTHSTSNIRPFRYGGSGHKQYGLDLMAQNPDTGKNIVAECKKVADITSSSITSWVDRFLNDEKSKNTEKFILITSYSIGSKPKLLDHWHKESLRFKKNNIATDIWDFSILNQMLRNSHKTVETIYGYIIAEGFCLRSSGQTKYPRSYPEKKIYDLGRMKSIKNRTIQLDIFVPCLEEPHLSGGFSFSRSDLNGFTIAVAPEFLIDLMQHRAHTDSIKNVPQLYEMDQGKRYVFAMPSARFILEEKEIEDLDWIVTQAWKLYIKAAIELESKWRTLRFNRLEHHRFALELCTVEKWFWHEITRYAHDFDCSNGDTEHYIYDAAKCIKVYVPEERGNLDAGYHLIMYPHSSCSIYSDNIILAWEPFKNLSGEPVDFSPRKQWDAEYTHNWLMNYFFPRVYNRGIKNHYKAAKKFLFRHLLDKLLSRKETNYRPLSDIVTSYTNISDRNTGLRITSKEEAIDLTQELQSHFCVYMSRPSIEPKLVEAVVEVCQHFISTRPAYRSHYFESNLSIEGNNLYSEIESVKKSLIDSSRSTLNLDLALRSLYSLFEDLNDLSNDEFSAFSDLIRPVWDRYVEDKICKTYV